jgi:hypothetical protein
VRPKPHLNDSCLYDYAIKALGRHMRTEAELRRLMRMRVEPDDRGTAARKGPRPVCMSARKKLSHSTARRLRLTGSLDSDTENLIAMGKQGGEA